MVTLTVNKHCNLNCSFCSNDNFDSVFDDPNSEPSLNELKRRLSIFCQEKKRDTLTITGGEPTFRKDLFDLLDYSNSFNFSKIFLLSNGCRFYYLDYCQHFTKYSNLEIEIPLHHFDSNIHNGLVRTPNSFKYALKGIQNLISIGVKVNLRLILFKQNYLDLVEYANFVNKNLQGINKVVFIYPRIEGSAKKNDDSLIVPYSKLIFNVHKSLEKLSEFNIDYEILHFPFCILNSKYWSKTLKSPYAMDNSICSKCNKKSICSGISIDYVDKFGLLELKKFE